MVTMDFILMRKICPGGNGETLTERNTVDSYKVCIGKGSLAKFTWVSWED